MKRFISYLYEYGQGRKIRNIGFAKVELKDSEGIMQIHGKGIQPPGQGKVKVYLCYERKGSCIGIFQGEIQHTEPAVDYRLVYTSEDTAGQENFDKIAGIVLKTDDGRTYAALWGEKLIDPEMMKDQADLAKEFPLESKESQQEETKKLTNETAADSEAASPDESGSGMQEQEAPAEIVEDVQEQETPVEIVEETMGVKESGPEEQVSEPEEFPENESVEQARPTEEVRTEPQAEPEPEMSEMRMPKLQAEPATDEKLLHEMGCEETCQEPVIQYEKITREDLAKLPRCEWGNANNTFLLHGYRNYHHLLLIDDEGQMWLGVPGVYHEREQMAASSCGFPRFWRIPAEELGLSQEERNDREDFGYWCRKVRKRR